MKKLSFFLLTLAALASCKKDDKNSPASSPTDLLTAKNWRIASATATVSGQPFPGVLEKCSMDDYLKFNADKTLVHDAGATKCDPTDPQTENGTWSMPSDALLMMTIPNSGFPQSTFKIKELSATTMSLYTTDIQSGFPVTLDITLTAF